MTADFFAAPTCSVVICAYTPKRWNDLVEAVASLERQSLAPLEVIVVIDHNPELLRRAQAQFSHARVIENTFDKGLSGARNSGVEAARGEIVAFLDDDAAAERDWLERTLAGFADPQVMGVGSAIELAWPGQAPRWFPAEFFWTLGGTYRGLPTARAKVRNMIGAAMTLRRAPLLGGAGFLSAVGRTEAGLPLGCEETELCIRLSQTHPGSFFLYEPGTRVRHKVTPERATWRYFWSRCYAEGISKARVAQLVGGSDGLSSERSYTLRVLPAGVLRGLRDAVRGDTGGLGRAFAIVTGLFATAAGYLVGRWPRRNSGRPLPAAPASSKAA